MDFNAGFVNDDDREPAVRDPGVMPQPACQVPAVLDGPGIGSKFQARPVSGRNAILHIEIIGAHD
jgi:hypothetical protein